MSNPGPSWLRRDPFRLFFPLGWALALLGVAPWVGYAWNPEALYPGAFHGVLMSRGFLACFVLGFLMTAIPRFTETEAASGWELALGLSSIAAAALLAPEGRTSLACALTLLQIALIGVFIGRRVRRRRTNPPGVFLFVAIGLLMGALGSALEGIALAEWADVPPAWSALGHSASFYGMILALILGVGSRLFPGILGWEEIVRAQRDRYDKPVPLSEAVSPDVVAAAVLFLTAFFVEAFLNERVGEGLRAGVVTYLAIRYWRIHRLPPKRTWLNGCLIGAAWFVVIGEWIGAAFPEWGVDGRHLVFVGGFSLLCLLVSSRVILAHGEGLALEARWWPYAPVTVLILTASIARTAVRWTPASVFHHLAYASILWLLGAGVWGVSFLPRLKGTK